MNKQDLGHLYSEPLNTTHVGRAVVILGPDAVAISMTPEAARHSARLLLAAADEAERSDGPAAPLLPIEQG
jgi:hypothetical protein